MTDKQMTKKGMELAEALYEAYKTQKPLQMADWTGVVTTDDEAYMVQNALMKQKDEKVGGYKVSLTSKETQDMFDSNEPLYGAQVESHFVKSGTKLSLSKDLMDPLTEVELVFTAKEDLSADDSLEELAKKTTVAPGVEVPDCRFAEWFPSLNKYLVMSDAAVGGFVVYGEGKDTTDYSMDDLANVSTELFHNGEKVGEGKSSEVLGNPLNSLQWLVKKLASQGKTLTKGQKVSSGTFLLPPHLTEGKWEATFNEGMPTVTVEVTK